MTHGHLRFDFTCGLKNNTDHDYNRASGESERRKLSSGNDVRNKRNDCDHDEEESTDEGDSRKNLRDIVGRRLAGTDTGDKSAVLLEIVCDFDRIERYRNVEIRKSDDEYCSQGGIEPTVGAEEIEEARPEGSLLRIYEHLDRSRDGDDGVRKDHRHNAGHVDLERKS